MLVARALLFLLLSCGAICNCSKIELVEFKSGLSCTGSEGLTASPSQVGGSREITCNSDKNSYTRAVFDAEITSDTSSQPLTASHEFFVVAQSGTGDKVFAADGCKDRTPGDSRGPECAKLQIPMRTLNNTFSLSVEQDLIQFLGLSQFDVHNMIQGFNVSVEFGHTRWAYDLDPLVNTIFPYRYDVTINATEEAFMQAKAASELNGLTTKLARCYPEMPDSSSRIGGKLNACFRAACNCTASTTKAPGVPDLYTYEVQWGAPACNMRRVSNGAPRLTVDATVTVTAIIKINGTTRYSAQIFSQTFDDITSTKTNLAGKGNIGSASGIEGLVQRAFGGSGIFQLTSSGQYTDPDRMVAIDSQTQGGAYNSPVVMFKAHLKNAYVGNFDKSAPKKFLGSAQRFVASTAHFNLAGGYIVDCLTDKEVTESPYRLSTANPYNEFGLPDGGEGAPPDRWFYMTDAISRRGSLFNPHLRDSCGLLGTSSAAIALQGNVNNGSLCCDGTLTNGGCVPGGGHPNSFESPEDILSNGSLWKKSFSPPGYRSYNYYMYGHNKLYMQPPKQAVSGLSAKLNGAATAVFEIVLEISDLLVHPKAGATSMQANIPPLRLEVDPNPVFQIYSPDEPVVCVYNPDGRGAIVFQRLCNAGSGGASANVSVTFERCSSNLRYPGVNSTSIGDYGPIRVLPESGSLSAGKCYDIFSFPIHVDDVPTTSGQESVGCESFFVSATLGSTREVEMSNLVCKRFDRPWNAPATAQGYTLHISDVDPDCKRCANDDLYCLNECGMAYSSPWFLVLYWIPIGGFCVGALIYIMVFCIQDSVYQSRGLTSVRRTIWKSQYDPFTRRMATRDMAK